jgi:parvulin-like peptidyl-prolyl isomerase
VSPSQRKRPTTGKGNSGSAAGRSSAAAPLQRLGLIIFGAVFVLFFVGFAIAQGIGHPSVPAGDVALIESVPSNIGHVSEAEYKRSLLQTASQGGLKKLPKPGEKQYEELQKSALGNLFSAIWIQGQAEEMGIVVSEKQIATELAQIKKSNFKTAAAYKKFLKTSHFTESDVNQRVKLKILGTQIQQQIGKSTPMPSSSQTQQYYEAAKATQFTTPPSRDVRLVLNKDKAKVEAAKAQVEKDHSTASWAAVAKKYSTDPTSKSSGGVVAGVTEGRFQEPLNSDIFSAPKGQLQGPIKTPLGYYVFVVEKATPKKVEPLTQVKSQISSQLTQQAQQEAFTQFVSNYSNKWQSRTFCASGYTIERCANYPGAAHPASAPPACYEAHPKGGLPAACPAPVQQLAPALPGTVTVLAPKGQQLPQRPQPAGLKPVTATTGTGLSGLPAGATGTPGATGTSTGAP